MGRIEGVGGCQSITTGMGPWRWVFVCTPVKSSSFNLHISVSGQVKQKLQAIASQLGKAPQFSCTASVLKLFFVCSANGQCLVCPPKVYAVEIANHMSFSSRLACFNTRQRRSETNLKKAKLLKTKGIYPEANEE